MMGRKCQVNKLKPFYDQSVYLACSENIFSDFYCILIRLNDLFINCQRCSQFGSYVVKKGERAFLIMGEKSSSTWINVAQLVTHIIFCI